MLISTLVNNCRYFRIWNLKICSFPKICVCTLQRTRLTSYNLTSFTAKIQILIFMPTYVCLLYENFPKTVRQAMDFCISMSFLGIWRSLTNWKILWHRSSCFDLYFYILPPDKKYAPDWNCSNCNFSNFAKRAKCKQCSAKKDASEVGFLSWIFLG